VSRIFISHSSANSADAIALRDWLISEGWSDLFVDLDPDRGLKAGERWQEALKNAAHRCEVVVFLISPSWARSKWCLAEFLLAKSLNKQIFGVVVEATPFEDMPIELTAEWQIIDLSLGIRDEQFNVTLPSNDSVTEVTYSKEGLRRLAIGLRQAGLDAHYFAWPPAHEPRRSPYRGLRPLEADDAGIFFGREAGLVEAIDRLRGLAQAAPPRLMIILGASGAGKSSFMRAGLLPRLGRAPQTFLPLTVIRPNRTPISGETGLVNALANAFEDARLKVSRSDIQDAVQASAATFKLLLKRLTSAAQFLDGSVAQKEPTLVIAIDQAEELFLAETNGEAKLFLELMRTLLVTDAPPVIVVFTIRSDNYEQLQSAPELEAVHQETQSLPPMLKGSYADVVRGPLRRLEGTARAIKLDDNLSDALLADIEAGGGKDALPLLAFTLERLYNVYAATGHLTLDQYFKLGRMQGSIKAAVERAFEAADADPRIPRDRQARLTLLRRGLIPWLAGIDPETKAPRRRVARLSEIPAEARPLIDLLVGQYLLSTDVSQVSGEKTIEPAHEALLRQWQHLTSWLAEDVGMLTIIEGIKRASRDWAANAKEPSWLAHTWERRRDAERLLSRPDLAAHLEVTDREYLEACKNYERAERKEIFRRKLVFGGLTSLVVCLLGIGASVWYWRAELHSLQYKYFIANPISKNLVSLSSSFAECTNSENGYTKYCPTMIVVPSGRFSMGSADGENGRFTDEGPVREVTIKSFALSVHEVTGDQYGACVKYGGCKNAAGTGRYPATQVSWEDAVYFALWLSKMTGARYRLPTEAEWEYAARAGTVTAFPWGDQTSKQFIRCRTCSEDWDETQAAPVGSYPANNFGLRDMHGNVWEWVQDCYHRDYTRAPLDGSSWGHDCTDLRRILRGGSWSSKTVDQRSATRNKRTPTYRDSYIGFRVARDLTP
jgi:formylglycine-generating enzyme required for sulfatase activity